jgi:hypothetical protein
MHAEGMEIKRLTGQNSEQKDVIREGDKARTSEFVEYTVLIKRQLQLHVHILLRERQTYHNITQ